MTKRRQPEDGSFYAATELVARERFIGQVYEPAHQDEGIAKALLQNGNSLFFTTCNFLEYDAWFPSIVTEPRLDLALSWARRALHVTYEKVALLLPLSFMETAEAKKLFDETPLVRVYVFTKRLPFRRGAVAWFIWQRGAFERPVIRWL